MELIFKSAAAAISGAVIIMLIKRHNPELSTILSICTVTVILISALTFVSELKELVRTAVRLSGTSDIYISAVLTCLAVSIVTKLGSDICRDASQAALASTVEFAGTVCAVSIVLPIVSSMLELVGEMV